MLVITRPCIFGSTATRPCPDLSIRTTTSVCWRRNAVSSRKVCFFAAEPTAAPLANIVAINPSAIVLEFILILLAVSTGGHQPRASDNHDLLR